ncbi:hypothetical protein P152DRAFT_178605 [Eremomyces bilateralis CBS 781.70]|uniref:DUF7892 domain-containing protein n=1 Tax=Eremomyces bilateralis CBS 781.70 TaxID=1392243 RepID=A0A6G1FTC8_9PEZI|nr:uncharacterized protein P152DRAFT_178605 [Eremomyces bilateralis CBS 781.70]KAF1808968.1 hypothetical protein P152DRAFT_178605 [Eremomyces bilateralis CBS 781.70]
MEQLVDGQETNPNTFYAAHPSSGTHRESMTPAFDGSNKRKAIPASEASNKRLRKSPGLHGGLQWCGGLPGEIWQRVFLQLLPFDLGRLLRVNGAFNYWLTNVEAESKHTDSPQLPRLASSTIWAQSRAKQSSRMPKPIQPASEQRMWQLICGTACQFCGRRDSRARSSGSHAGDGKATSGTHIVWPFLLRSCLDCLEARCETEDDLFFSEQSHLRAALPYLPVDDDRNILLFRNIHAQLNASRPGTVTKWFYKRDVKNLEGELAEKLNSVGKAATRDWFEGLKQTARERIREYIAWETWFHFEGNNLAKQKKPSSHTLEDEFVPLSGRSVSNPPTDDANRPSTFAYPPAHATHPLADKPSNGRNDMTAKEMQELEWKRLQEPVRAELGTIADNFIRMNWSNGSLVSKENCSKFAAEVLLGVRRNYYQNSSSGGGRVGAEMLPGKQKLVLENMKWVFDNKIRQHTDPLRKELFFCSSEGCRGTFKQYAFEGVIQHFGARHTPNFRVGGTTLNWQAAEWPEDPPFHPDPNSLKSNPAFSGFFPQPPGSAFGYGGYSRAASITPHRGQVPFLPPQMSPAAVPPAQLSGSPQTGYRLPGAPAGQYGGFSPAPPLGQVPLGYPGHVSGLPGSDGVDAFTANNNSQFPLVSGPPNTNPMPGAVPWNSGPSTSQSIPVSILGPEHAHDQMERDAEHPFVHPEPVRSAQDSSAAYPLLRTENPPSTTRDVSGHISEKARYAWDIMDSPAIPLSVRMFVAIYHALSSLLTDAAVLEVLYDVVNKHGLMHPLKLAGPLSCRSCVTVGDRSGRPASGPHAERQFSTFSALLSHFRDEHTRPGSYANFPAWLIDMIALPEAAVLVYIHDHPSMTVRARKLLREAFPTVFKQHAPETRSPSTTSGLSTLERKAPVPGQRDRTLQHLRAESPHSDSMPKIKSEGSASYAATPYDTPASIPARVLPRRRSPMDIEHGLHHGTTPRSYQILPEGQGEWIQDDGRPADRYEEPLSSTVDHYRARPDAYERVHYEQAGARVFYRDGVRYERVPRYEGARVEDDYDIFLDDYPSGRPIGARSSYRDSYPASAQEGYFEPGLREVNAPGHSEPVYITDPYGPEFRPRQRLSTGVEPVEPVDDPYDRDTRYARYRSSREAGRARHAYHTGQGRRPPHITGGRPIPARQKYVRYAAQRELLTKEPSLPPPGYRAEPPRPGDYRESSTGPPRHAPGPRYLPHEDRRSIEPDHEQDAHPARQHMYRDELHPDEVDAEFVRYRELPRGPDTEYYDDPPSANRAGERALPRYYDVVEAPYEGPRRSSQLGSEREARQQDAVAGPQEELLPPARAPGYVEPPS